MARRRCRACRASRAASARIVWHPRHCGSDRDAAVHRGGRQLRHRSHAVRRRTSRAVARRSIAARCGSHNRRNRRSRHRSTTTAVSRSAIHHRGRSGWSSIFLRIDASIPTGSSYRDQLHLIEGKQNHHETPPELHSPRPCHGDGDHRDRFRIACHHRQRRCQAPPTETDVMAWLDAVDPAITVDQSANCMAGATDAVAYRNDRIVLRTGANDVNVKNTVNFKLNQMYGGADLQLRRADRADHLPQHSPRQHSRRPGGVSHAGSSSQWGAARRSPPRPAAAERVGSVWRPRLHTHTVWPVRSLLADGLPAEDLHADAAADESHPAHRQRDRHRREGRDLRHRIWPRRQPTSCRRTSMLAPTDNELLDVVNNGPLMVDYPHGAHGKAIAGVITTIAPGSTIQEVRINDRSGLLTDVSAVRGIASSLRTLARCRLPGPHRQFLQHSGLRRRSPGARRGTAADRARSRGRGCRQVRSRINPRAC